MSRKGVAREIDIAESVLRLWEDEGHLPTFGSLPERDYRIRAVVIAGARDRGVTFTELAELGIITGGMMGNSYALLTEKARFKQRDHVARYMKPLSDAMAMQEVIAENQDLYAQYLSEVGRGEYEAGGLRGRRLDEVEREPEPPRKTVTMTELDRLTDERLAADPKLTRVQARNLIFEERPHLYHAYRAENTRTMRGDRQ